MPNNFLTDKRIIPVVPVAVLEFPFKIYELFGTILKNSAFALTLRRVTVSLCGDNEFSKLQNQPIIGKWLVNL